MFVATVFCVALAISAAVAQSGSVLFTALLTNEPDISISRGIVYPTAITNHGNAYNAATGVFTATKGGAYLFTFHGVSTNGGTFWTDLYKNDAYVLSAYGNTVYSYGGNTATFILTKGDRVYIRSRRAVYLFGEPDQIYSSFSGVLVGQ